MVEHNSRVVAEHNSSDPYGANNPFGDAGKGQNDKILGLDKEAAKRLDLK